MYSLLPSFADVAAMHRHFCSHIQTLLCHWWHRRR